MLLKAITVMNHMETRLGVDTVVMGILVLKVLIIEYLPAAQPKCVNDRVLSRTVRHYHGKAII